MSSINIEKISIVHWYPELETHRCGYCKNEMGAVSYGMWAEQLTVDDYQNLIDRGWRRSGMYCYKPMMDLTCCPQYSIRCNVLNFQLSKSQKKIIKKLNKYLVDGVRCKEDQDQVPMDDSAPREHVIVKDKPNFSIDRSKFNGISETFDEVDVEISDTNVGCSSINEAAETVDEAMQQQETNSKLHCGSFKQGVGADPNKPPRKKAKLLRIERKQRKLLQKGMDLEKSPLPKNEVKTLEQLLDEIPVNSKHKLKIKLIPTIKFNKELENVKNIEFELYKKYQMAVHNDPPEKCSMGGFTRFLISSPLKSVRVRVANSSVTYGTFHQQYWMDDKLIAVAVLDILPRCISSVYFFYDPDYRFLTLGTYGSLREVQFVQSLHKSVPALQYYYMGFYIHSCPKMRYKGKLSRSFLLCPETYQWFPIDKCVIKLEKNKYSRLNDDIDAVDENLCTPSDIDRVKVCVSYSFTIFANYKQKYGEQEVFDNIGKLIGKKCAANLLFVCSKS